ncbi:glycosyltransferase [Echinicola vietnamensis]|uniref:Glycosyl transferase n=1 Tax=Echinicola vietnamensis (strain DSM 17526 / LMG 23754 / KMM 6221) TaxID=926556 RepID=L0FTL3_ECHVK|nr:glycosyltransferase [Echinicola vietnamensis]AGA76383.1 glycosyl transferase [Echinicola vietnamensis DSM 17526]
MNLLPILLFAALLVYLLSLAILSSKWKWRRAKNERIQGGVDYPVTLLVPFRNEKKNLPGLLRNLAGLSYPNLQIILIDDHSEDGGGDQVEAWILAENKHNFKLISGQGQGKKAAIEQGVVMANANIILTTDADCTLSADWVQNMLRAFDDPSVQMVAGPVMTKGGDGTFDHFQQIDWASILLMTNFFFSIKKPVMCSAANMGYRKEAFYHIKGYQGNHGNPSGDDSYLLEKIYQRFGHQAIRYLASSNVLVKTHPVGSISGFLEQRSRWASKWNKHQFWQNAGGAVLSAFLSLASICSILLLLTGPIGVAMFAVYWFLKLLFEYFVLRKVLNTYEIPLSVGNLFLASVLHPIYVILVAFRSFLVKSRWKGRK